MPKYDSLLELTLHSTVGEWFSHPVTGPALRGAFASGAAGDGGARLTPELLRMISSMPMQKVLDMLGGAVSAELIDALMRQTREAARPTRTCARSA